MHVSRFMLELFAEEHTAYQTLLRELPTARPEQLVQIIEAGPPHRDGQLAGVRFQPIRARSARARTQAVRGGGCGAPPSGRKKELLGASRGPSLA